MTTKERLTELFERNRGRYLSGEEIARELSVSRAAVWKAVKSLKDDGYAIDAVTNKGYCLSEKSDILSAQGIKKYLSPEHQKLAVCVVQTAASTNAMALEMAGNGAGEGYVAVANEQTKGRGRYGRPFFSPRGTGLYLSLLLRPDGCSADRALAITTMAAVSVCEAIEEVSKETASIKWVNDVYVREKKVCGILTEASVSLESGLLEYAVLGVGVNVYEPEKGFPDELKKIAGAVFDREENDGKNRLAAAFINRFMEYYRERDNGAYIEKYRDKSFVVGRPVKVISEKTSRSAYAYGIDDACRLQVRYEDGGTESLSYGEISVEI